jgi:hypothetical protein
MFFCGLRPSSLVSLARQEDRQKQTGFRRNFVALTMFFCGLHPSSLVSLARQEDCMSFQQKKRLCPPAPPLLTTTTNKLIFEKNCLTTLDPFRKSLKKKALLRPGFPGLRRAKVELEGVEPSSKQGTDTLSTCLSPYWLSGVAREEAPKPNLIPFISSGNRDLLRTSLNFACVPCPDRNQATPSAERLVPDLVRD